MKASSDRASGLHVGIVAPEFPPALGGIEIYGWELARELIGRGHRVTVYTRRHPQGEAHLPGADIRPSLQACRKLDRRLLRNTQVDIWHPTNAAYAWLAIETETPVIVSVHGDDFKCPYIPVARFGVPDVWRLPRLSNAMRTLDRSIGRFLTAPLLRRAFPRVAHIIANSRYTERFFLHLYPSCAGRTSVAFVGVSDEFFSAAPPPPPRGGPMRLITVARLSQGHKNIDTVLRALAGLKADFDFTYSIVGDGHLKASLEGLRDELRLQDRVRFLGRLPGDELRNQLASHDLFVLASKANRTSYEGFGIVYLEANACGTPVLATKIGGAPEAVLEGVSGMLAEDAGLSAISAKLRAFLAGEERFERADCVRSAERFRWRHVVDRIEGSYFAALPQRRLPAESCAE